MSLGNLDKIRVSIGTAAMLGLDHIRLNLNPLTAYLLTYYDGRCTANCQFCAHARESTANINRLARGLYLPYQLKVTADRLSMAVEKSLIKRVCLQTINYPGMHKDVLKIVQLIKSKVDVPITVSRHPLTYKELEELRELGVDRVLIPLDAATKDIFTRIKGSNAKSPYTWEGHWNGLRIAQEIFGKKKVGTHIILGLGETEEEAVRTIEKLCSLKVTVGLFAYVPIKGAPLGGLPKPPAPSYHRIQLAYYLLRQGICSLEEFIFKNGNLVDFGIDKSRFSEIIESGEPFVTAGCRNCNRPYSTEGPLGPIYNYAESPSKNEIKEIRRQLEL